MTERSVSDSVEIAIEYRRVLQHVGDISFDEVERRETLDEEFTRLAETRQPGESFEQLNLLAEAIPLTALTDAIDVVAGDKLAPTGIDLRGYPVDPDDTRFDGYTIEELNHLGHLHSFDVLVHQQTEPDAWQSHGRRALYRSDMNTGIDPLIHNYGEPFDSEGLALNNRGASTQLKRLDLMRLQVERKSKGYNFAGLNLPAILAVLAGRLIANEQLPFTGQDVMFIPQLRRQSISHPSWARAVGAVAFNRSSMQIGIGAADRTPDDTKFPFRRPTGGIGVSIGNDVLK
jgi:hypothetical protein